jgi:hypothetical protein
MEKTHLVERLMSSVNTERDIEFEKFFKSRLPKGWISIEQHLPIWLPKDVLKGFSSYMVKNHLGQVFQSKVTDHNLWKLTAIKNNITHWYND